MRFIGGHLGALAMAAALLACSPEQYVPNLVGLVAGTEYLAQDTRYTLADGRQFTFPRNGTFIGGSEPRAGAILIAGSEPVPWVFWAAILGPDATTPEGCYAIFGKATANATHVFLTVGDPRGDVTMVFRKAADWDDHGVEGPSNQLKGPYTCINPQGEAFERGL